MLFVLEFKLSDTSKSDIEKAKSQFDSAISKVRIDFLEYKDMGKDSFKAQKLSPDSMMQFAFQVSARAICI